MQTKLPGGYIFIRCNAMVSTTHNNRLYIKRTTSGPRIEPSESSFVVDDGTRCFSGLPEPGSSITGEQVDFHKELITSTSSCDSYVQIKNFEEALYYHLLDKLDSLKKDSRIRISTLCLEGTLYHVDAQITDVKEYTDHRSYGTSNVKFGSYPLGAGCGGEQEEYAQREVVSDTLEKDLTFDLIFIEKFSFWDLFK